MAAGGGGAQCQEEDDNAADGHDAHLAADYRQGQGALPVLGEVLELDLAEFLIGGAGASALGEEGDWERQNSVEDVEVTGRDVPGEQQQHSEHRLDHDGNLGAAEQVPEGNRRLVTQPADPSDDRGSQIQSQNRDADNQMDLRHQLNPACNRRDLPRRCVKSLCSKVTQSGCINHSHVLQSYLPVLVFLGLGVTFGTLFAVLNHVLGPKRSRVETSSSARQTDPYECGLPSDVTRTFRFGVSFYLVAMLFILFDIEVVFLYPVGVLLKGTGGVFVLGEILVFIGLLLVAFVYVWRKGALNWR